MSVAEALAPYEPVALYYHDADCIEYLRADEPRYYRRIDGSLTLILSFKTDVVIGFRIKGFRNFYLRKIKPQYDEAAFIPLLGVVERIMGDMGNQLFEDTGRQAAYETAAELARDVQLGDLPRAA